ncbi:MAG: hypothetical protein V2I33_22580, partial [Kangiellaceae bacterium]|nr:hypothetical protein [Kangiellaceae bacterium]
AEVAEIAPEPEAQVSLGRQVAQITSGFFESAANSLSSAMTGLTAMTSSVQGLDADQLTVLYDALLALAVVLLATVVSYLVLHHFAKRIYRSMGERAHDWDIWRTLAVWVATVLIDAAVVILAWGLGYLAALYLHGDPGTMGVRQSLYLNAFLLVGLAKVVLRMVLSPSTGDLRFIAISEAAAKRMSAWLGAIATIIGYGQLLIVPIVNQQASFSAGRGVSTLLAFVAIATALVLVLRNRTEVTAWLLGPAPQEKPSVMRFLARSWYIPLVAYLVGLALIVAARPDGLIWPVLLTTGKLIAVVTLGILVSGALSRFGMRGLRLPEMMKTRMPSLQFRLNGLVGQIIAIARVVIGITVLGLALDIMGLLDFSALVQGETGRWIIGTAISVGFILLFGLV